MQTRDPEELKREGGSAVVIDLASVSKLSNDFHNGWLTDERAVLGYRRKFEEADFWTEQLFEVLSNLICFDKFIIDERALFSFHEAHKFLAMLNQSKLDELFVSIIFPIDIYNSAADSI